MLKLQLEVITKDSHIKMRFVEDSIIPTEQSSMDPAADDSTLLVLPSRVGSCGGAPAVAERQWGRDVGSYGKTRLIPFAHVGPKGLPPLMNFLPVVYDGSKRYAESE